MNPINSGVSSSMAQRTFNSNALALHKSLERLATGQRINRGSDDPAGLIASEKLRAALAELDAESRSAERAEFVIATADGALSEINGLLSEAGALVVANANSAGLSDAEREANQIELNSILSSVNRIANATTFNGDKLLDGSATINASGESIDIEAISTGAIDIVSGSLADAEWAIDSLRDQVTTLRGELGAFAKNTIESDLRAKEVAMENLSAAESAIRDTDYALETANLARLKILNKASAHVLRISNDERKNVLNLLG